MGKDGLHRHGWRNCPETVRSSTCTPSPRHALRRAHGAVLCLVRSCDHRCEIGGCDIWRASGSLLHAHSPERDIDAAFAELVQKRIDAFFVPNDARLFSRRAQILTLASRHAIPAIYFSRDWAAAGGLMSYGPPAIEQGRQAGIYTGRILKGEKPSDLPVVQATRFEFIINLATARAIGVEVPPTLLSIADEVIE